MRGPNTQTSPSTEREGGRTKYARAIPNPAQKKTENAKGIRTEKINPVPKARKTSRKKSYVLVPNSNAKREAGSRRNVETLTYLVRNFGG